MISHEMKYRVLYADTDAMGVMYYANYFRVYEAARGELMRKIGFSFSDSEAKGIVCPAITVKADYLKSAKFDEEVTVVSIIEEMPKAKLVFHQTMYDCNKNILNNAVITLGFVKTENFRAVRCPDWLSNKFVEAMK
jgi:acyl-CoA thioester hydrolase